MDPVRVSDIALTALTPAVFYKCGPDDKADSSVVSNEVTYGNVGPDLSFSRDLVEVKGELGRGAFGRVLLGTALGIEESGKLMKVAIKTVKGMSVLITWLIN